MNISTQLEVVVKFYLSKPCDVLIVSWTLTMRLRIISGKQYFFAEVLEWSSMFMLSNPKRLISNRSVVVLWFESWETVRIREVSSLCVSGTLKYVPKAFKIRWRTNRCRIAAPNFWNLLGTGWKFMKIYLWLISEWRVSGRGLNAVALRLFLGDVFPWFLGPCPVKSATIRS